MLVTLRCVLIARTMSVVCCDVQLLVYMFCNMQGLTISEGRGVCAIIYNHLVHSLVNLVRRNPRLHGQHSGSPITSETISSL